MVFLTKRGDTALESLKHVSASPKLTIRTGFALTSVCRVAEMVIDRSVQTARTVQFSIGGITWSVNSMRTYNCSGFNPAAFTAPANLLTSDFR